MAIPYRNSRQYNVNTMRLEGYIGLAADASVVTVSTFLTGATVTKSGTGEYTVTLSRRYNILYNCQVTFESDTDVDVNLQIDDINLNQRTVKIKTLVAGTPTDVSNISRIFFYLAVRSL